MWLRTPQNVPWRGKWLAQLPLNLLGLGRGGGGGWWCIHAGRIFPKPQSIDYYRGPPDRARACERTPFYGGGQVGPQA